MTPLLCVLIPRPGRVSRSSMHTLAPDSASFSAHERPTTPPPITATSISFIQGDTILFSVYVWPESAVTRPDSAVRPVAWRRACSDDARLRYAALHSGFRGRRTRARARSVSAYSARDRGVLWDRR